MGEASKSTKTAGSAVHVKVAVLDTNFLLLPARKHRDVITELSSAGWRLEVLEQTVRELTKLSVGTSQTALAARLALQLIKQKGLNIVQGSVRYTDTAILAYCRTRGAAAATQDAALRTRLRAAGVAVITLNRSGKLATEETHVLQAQGARPHPRPARPLR